MNIIFIAPPAAGKGTYSSLLKTKYNFTHISAGDVLREVVNTGTPLGEEVNKIMKRGEMINDEIICKLIESKLTQIDLSKPFMLDGFPRKINQALELEKILNNLKINVDKVIFINITKETGLKRILGRITCPVCKRIYNLENPELTPKNIGVCDDCSTELTVRKDDTKEAYETRYDIYMNETLPLIEYYKGHDKLVEIDGSGTVEEVFENIENILGVKND